MGNSKAHRAALKSREWNKRTKTPREPLTKDSWWMSAARPDQFDDFTAAARKRDDERGWSTILPHAMDPKKAFR